jgi:NitT/TauT family transport system substrate-binding protein
MGVRPLLRVMNIFLPVFLAVLALSAPLLQAREIKVGTWKTAQTIQPFFYEHFYPSGTRISVFAFTNPVDQKSALLVGDLDMCGTTVAHAIQSAVKGEPVVLVASLCNKCSALVVPRDGGIESVADLRGKKIGYVPGTMHEILLRETLTRHGLSPQKDVVLVRVDFFDMGTALAAGNIDAFLSGEPFPSVAVEKGYGKILAYPYFDESIGAINGGMLVRRQAIEKEPEKVTQLVLAHARATRHLREHPGEWLKKATEFGVPVSVLEKALPNMELAWEMDEAFVAKARALGEKMLALGLIERLPDYERLFDLSFVRRVQGELRLQESSIH